MTSITIPNSITSIGLAAFNRGLRKIVCLAITPPACSESFYGLSMCKVYVPKGTLSAYQATAPWSEFLFIREGMNTGSEESGAIVIDVWDGVEEISTARNSSGDYVEMATPQWVEDVDASWGISNNSYVCFTAVNSNLNFDVRYHSDEVIAGEQYKLQIIFAPETREEMSQLPTKVNIYSGLGEDKTELANKLVVSGTETTTFEADNIVVPQNSFDLTIRTNVSSADVRNGQFVRTLRIAKIRLIRMATSINSLRQSTPATDSYYTLDGRKIVGKPARPGLYIQNGSKVFFKN